MDKETMPQQERETFEYWMKRFFASMNYVEPFFKELKENYYLYKSYKQGSDKVYKYDIFVPYSFAIMEDAVAYFMLTVLAAKKIYSLFPRFKSVSAQVCLELEECVQWAINAEETEFALELEECIKNLSIYGVGYLTHLPVVDSDNNFKRLHVSAPGFFDVYPEPAKKRFSRAGWIIKRSWETYESLKDMEGKPNGYKNIDSVKDGERGETEYNVESLLSDIGFSTTEVADGYDKKARRIEILDCMKDGNIITIGGRKRVIRDTTQESIRPFSFPIPVLDTRSAGAPGEFFGVSLLQSMKPLQKELNLLRSQRRDNIGLLLNKLFVYDMLAGEVDLDTVFSAPGNIITVMGRQALDEFPISDVTGSSFKESQELMYDIQNVTNMWDYARGATPKRRETATTVVRLQQAAQGRMEWSIRKLDYYILQPLCKRILVYLREYLSKDDYDKIVGTPNAKEEFYKLDVKDIARSIQIMPLTESLTNMKEIDTQQFIQAFDRLIQVPEVNRAALVKQLLTKLGQKDLKDILPEMNARSQQSVMEGQEQLMMEQARQKEMMEAMMQEQGGTPNA